MINKNYFKLFNSEVAIDFAYLQLIGVETVSFFFQFNKYQAHHMFSPTLNLPIYYFFHEIFCLV